MGRLWVVIAYSAGFLKIGEVCETSLGYDERPLRNLSPKESLKRREESLRQRLRKALWGAGRLEKRRPLDLQAAATVA